ncbi:MAG TPA: GNAT family N-acetyltransferase [Pyrinomonadaceae bacterium]|jgi:ribosomal-protein-alanine N-acetyltransferase
MREGEPYPVIETERLRLILPPPEAAPRLLKFEEENLEHLAPWSPPCPPEFYTEAYWYARLKFSREDFIRGHSMRLVLFDREEPEGAVVGECNFSNIMRGPFHACYLGYKLDHRAVGRGLMHEALAGAIAYAFESLKLHRIMANYLPTNERSGRLLRRLGFVVEGYARDYLLIAGKWQDHIMTALTNTHLRPEDVR